jgi:hypothetical protein
MTFLASHLEKATVVHLFLVARAGDTGILAAPGEGACGILNNWGGISDEDIRNRLGQGRIDADFSSPRACVAPVWNGRPGLGRGTLGHVPRGRVEHRVGYHVAVGAQSEEPDEQRGPRDPVGQSHRTQALGQGRAEKERVIRAAGLIDHHG